MMNLHLSGLIVSGLMSLALMGSGASKLMRKPAMVKNLRDLGFKAESLQGLGIIEVFIVALYLIPQTSFVGAILVV